MAKIPDTDSRSILPILTELKQQGAVASEEVKKNNGVRYTAYKLHFDPDDGQAHPTMKTQDGEVNLDAGGTV